ncbi:MAG: hypothetical protein O3A47_05050 [Chloroflexi bacterium]|nr:hypothetical protein [Chloroflexota bacterium]
MRAFEKLVDKITGHVGHRPTDEDLRRLGREGLMGLQTNKAERNVAGIMARRLEGGDR